MPEGHQCGVTAALGLTCKAFFPGCSPEAIPGPAAGAPGVVAEASPELGPRRCHPHPHPLPQPWHCRHSSGPRQIHPLSSCLLRRSLQGTAAHGCGRSRQGTAPAGPSTEHSPAEAQLPPPVNTAVPPTGRINKELRREATHIPGALHLCIPNPCVSCLHTAPHHTGWQCLGLGFLFWLILNRVARSRSKIRCFSCVRGFT